MIMTSRKKATTILNLVSSGFFLIESGTTFSLRKSYADNRELLLVYLLSELKLSYLPNFRLLVSSSVSIFGSGGATGGLTAFISFGGLKQERENKT